MKDLFGEIFSVARKNIRTSIAVLLCVLCTLFLIKLLKGDEHTSINVHVVSDVSGEYDIRGEYPQFVGLSRSFNKKIESSVLSAIEEFKVSANEAKESAEEGDQTPVYIFRVSWVPDQISGDFVSIVLRQYAYTGGAHGIQGIETFTYDRKNKKVATLPDIFSGVPGYLDKISGYAMNDLKNQLGEDAVMNMIREGTAPKVENFQTFSISRDNVITFYFSEYQVAPYASGEQKVMMPLSYVKDASN